MKISEIITDKYKLRIPPTVYYELLADVQEVEEDQEPTTKNNLSSELDKNSKKLEKDFGELDCISREQALVAIRNLYPGMPRVDFNGSLRKWVDKYKPYIECDDAIKQLPSVTPQEPFKPMVEIDLYSVIKQKYIEREVLDKIREQIKSHLRGVEITLEVLVENDPLRPKMEGAKDTLEECLELIVKAEMEADNGNDE